MAAASAVPQCPYCYNRLCKKHPLQDSGASLAAKGAWIAPVAGPRAARLTPRRGQPGSRLLDASPRPPHPLTLAGPVDREGTLNRLYQELIAKNLSKARMEEVALKAEREERVRARTKQLPTGRMGGVGVGK
jgi:hypothetical protein